MKPIIEKENHDTILTSEITIKTQRKPTYFSRGSCQ